jgi:hypothetical protein
MIYSITSSAIVSRVAGTATPSARAVLRLITNSNLGVSSGMVELSLSPRGTSMEKIILLCLIVGLIGVLAELSPVLSSQK